MTDHNYDATTVNTWLDTMAQALRQLLEPESWAEIGMIGIHTGGVRIAEALYRRLPLELPLGTLDISFYRDDFSHLGLHPEVKASSIPFTVERTLILVDDVVYSGRTVRAALNTLFDYGRPARVLLATLVEREGHALPIRADVKGLRINLHAKQRIRLNSEDLGLSIVEAQA